MLVVICSNEGNASTIVIKIVSTIALRHFGGIFGGPLTEHPSFTNHQQCILYHNTDYATLQQIFF